MATSSVERRSFVIRTFRHFSPRAGADRHHIDTNLEGGIEWRKWVISALCKRCARRKGQVKVARSIASSNQTHRNYPRQQGLREVDPPGASRYSEKEHGQGVGQPM